jgi:hypothetical protein
MALARVQARNDEEAYHAPNTMTDMTKRAYGLGWHGPNAARQTCAGLP